MRHALTAVVWALLATAAAAQDAPSARRLELAERYVDLAQGDGIQKLMTTIVSAEMGRFDEATEDQRQWVRTNMPAMLTRHIATMLDAMVPIYAERMTQEELEALVAFHETPVGRSVSQKQLEIGVVQSREMEAVIQGFGVEFLTKFCAEFDCGDGPSAPAPSKLPD